MDLCKPDAHLWHYRDIVLEDHKKMATCGNCPAVWLWGTVYLPTSLKIDENEVRRWTFSNTKEVIRD